MSTTDSLLVADDLARHYAVKRGPFGPSATLKALDGVSFRLARRRTLAVVGESGSGKSTLARLLTLIESPSRGRLVIDGVDAGGPPAALRSVRRAVQMIFQDPYGSLNPRKQIGSILEEPLVINTDMPAAERHERAQTMLGRVGLRPEHAGRYPHMFSGGQRQRIAIARALMLNPAILIADEPVSALDVSVQAQVLNMLIDLQAEFDLAYVFISHDLSVVRHIANDVLVLYLGRPVEQASRDDLFARPMHPYTQALLASTPSVDPSRRRARQPLRGEMPSPLNPPPGCAFHSRCAHATDRCTQERPALREVADRLVACHHAETIG